MEPEARRVELPKPKSWRRWSALNPKNEAYRSTLRFKAKKGIRAILDEIEAHAEGNDAWEYLGQGIQPQFGPKEIGDVLAHYNFIAAMRYILGADHALRVAQAVIVGAQSALGKTTGEMDLALALIGEVQDASFQPPTVWAKHVQKAARKTNGKAVQRG